jgi:hypothetical protein
MLTTQQFLKGLMLVVVSVFITYYTAPPPVDYLMMGLVAVSSILVYSGKNLIAVLHSDSPAGTLSFINVLSGFLVALGTGLVDAVAMLIVNGVIVWAVLWKLSLSILLTYIATTWLAPPYSPNTLKLGK